ncbi:MAG: hypothetical protein ACM31F_04360 [Gemmatimonas sp.]
MNTRNLLTIAAFGGLLVAAGCKDKDDKAEDSAGTAAMTDTTTMAPAPAVSTDTTAAPTTTDTTKTGTYGDTIKR